MKKGVNSITCSWDAVDNEEQDSENPHASELNTINFDDVPIDPLSFGPRHNKQMREMEAVNHMMSSLDWTEPLLSTCVQTEYFQPEIILTGSYGSKRWKRQSKIYRKKRMRIIYLSRLR